MNLKWSKKAEKIGKVKVRSHYRKKKDGNASKKWLVQKTFKVMRTKDSAMAYSMHIKNLMDLTRGDLSPKKKSMKETKGMAEEEGKMDFEE